MQISFYDGSSRFKSDKQVRLIELFGGIGCQAKALENLNIDFVHYKMCDFDKYAVQSYNAIHGTNFLPSDINKLKAEDLEIVETDKYEYIMTYSFPCTDLSKAGQQKGMARNSGTRSGLLWEVERLLDECKELPQVLLMENVPDVIGTKNMPHFAEWLKKLESLGYKSYWESLNAKNFGIPQNRERVFMVSLLGDFYYDFPKPFELKLRLKDMLEDEVDEKYYLSDKLVKNLSINCLGVVVNEKDLTTKNKRLKSMLGKIDVSKIQSIDMYNQTINEEMNTIKTTIDSSNMTAITQNLRIRKLTPKECWRLMGLNDIDFYKAKASGVSNSQLYKQAGNGIVVDVLMYIFKNLNLKEKAK